MASSSTTSTCTFPDCSTTIDGELMISNLAAYRTTKPQRGIVSDRALEQSYDKLMTLFQVTHDATVHDRKQGARWYDVIKKDFENEAQAHEQRKINEKRAYLHNTPSISSVDKNHYKKDGSRILVKQDTGNYKPMLAIEDVVPLANKWVKERVQGNATTASYEEWVRECTQQNSSATATHEEFQKWVRQRTQQNPATATYLKFREYLAITYNFPGEILEYARTDFKPRRNRGTRRISKKRPAQSVHASDETSKRPASTTTALTNAHAKETMTTPPPVPATKTTTVQPPPQGNTPYVTRLENENNRLSNEINRLSNENTRLANESSRHVAENACFRRWFHEHGIPIPLVPPRATERNAAQQQLQPFVAPPPPQVAETNVAQHAQQQPHPSVTPPPQVTQQSGAQDSQQQPRPSVAPKPQVAQQRATQQTQRPSSSFVPLQHLAPHDGELQEGASQHGQPHVPDGRLQSVPRCQPAVPLDRPQTKETQAAPQFAPESAGPQADEDIGVWRV